MIANLMGTRVIVNPLCDNLPRMTLDAKFASNMPESFVTETNAWLRDFFGTQSVAYRLGDGTVVVGPKAYAAMLEAA